MSERRYSWTQSICGRCYERREGLRVPVRMKAEFASVETCCDCGEKTREGIYYRADPASVRFPREKD